MDRNSSLKSVVQLPRAARLCGNLTAAPDIGRDRPDIDFYDYGEDVAEGRTVFHVLGHNSVTEYIFEQTLCGRGTADLPYSGDWGKLGPDCEELRCPQCLELAPLKPRRLRHPLRWTRPQRDEPVWWAYPPVNTRIDLLTAFAVSSLGFLFPPAMLFLVWHWRVSTYFGPEGVTVNRWIGHDTVPWPKVRLFATMPRGPTLKIVIVTEDGRDIKLTPLPSSESGQTTKAGLDLMAAKLNMAFGFGEPRNNAEA